MTDKDVMEPIQHPKISEVILIGKRDMFPISWLHKQEYCEYQIFLENVKGINVKPTKEMIEGKLVHKSLEKKFKEIAKPILLKEIIEKSKVTEMLSRELPVISIRHGIYGAIDEIRFTPNNFIIIDDKPGTKVYLSNVHQVYGYCLAFKDMIRDMDNRTIVAALRERGTDNIYWQRSFDEKAENEIIKIINRIHDLISGNEEFISNKNPNKCKSCRFREVCDKSVI